MQQAFATIVQMDAPQAGAAKKYETNWKGLKMRDCSKKKVTFTQD